MDMPLPTLTTYRLAACIVSVLANMCTLAATAQPPSGVAPASEAQPAVRSLLVPKFEKGQHVVLRQFNHQGQDGKGTVSSKVFVDVVEKAGDDVLLRWQVSEPEAPEGLTEEEHAKFNKMFANAKSPVMELVFKEGEGLIGIRDWEKTRDEIIALTERLMKESPELGGGDPEALSKAIFGMRRLMSSREATERILLKQVRPYFEGFYHRIEPGAQRVEEAQLPVPFGRTTIVPAKRTVQLTAASQTDPDVYTLIIDQVIDRDAAAEAIQAVVNDLAKGMGKTDALPTSMDIDISIALRWSFDTRRGWPSQVSIKNTQKIGSRNSVDEFSWMLLEGPSILTAPTDPPSALSPPSASPAPK